MFGDDWWTEELTDSIDVGGEQGLVFFRDPGEEQRELESRTVSCRRTEHLSTHHDSLDIQRLAVVRFVTWNGECHPYSEPGHLREIDVRGAVHTTDGKIGSHHPGDLAVLFDAPFDLDFVIEALVGAAFDARVIQCFLLIAHRTVVGPDESREESGVERDELKKLLGEVASGKVDVDGALQRLRSNHVESLEFATLDMHRALRRGFPEVVYGPGKSVEQVVAIIGRIHQAGQTVLVTRVEPVVFRAVEEVWPEAEYHEHARAIVLRTGRRKTGRAGIVVITAGTSDIAVADEAAVTAEVMGNRVERIYDVGVAGLHRLLAHRKALTTARVIIAVAGMEGALPSVVAGLTDCPVIGVPTSTGYGSGAGGKAAMLAMLNSCAAGMTVVNIDNGFGAGYAAALINRVK